MILIADGGSTKCDWMIADDSFQLLHRIETRGMNPLFVDEAGIKEILENASLLKDNREQIKEVRFYGAGCSSNEKIDRVSGALKSFFSDADIYVSHDTEAAAIATYNGTPGLSCILGTGSNICKFDGRDLVEGLPSLGFILGDEGSGAWIGKQLVTDYLYKRMPASLAKKFSEETRLDKELIINRIYREPDPNRFLAALSLFAANHREDEYLRLLIYEGFENFVQIHVSHFEGYEEMPVHFTGSIAHHNRDLLEECADKNDFELGNVIEKPGLSLLEKLKELDY